MCREERWNRSTTNLCPLCKKPPETIEHTFQCTHQLIQTNRSKAISKFKSSLLKFKTCPTLVNHLHRIMLRYCGGYSVPNVPLNFDNAPSEQLVLIAQAIAVQNKYLGVLNMSFDVVSPLFCSSQSKCYETKPQGRNFTSDRWGK